MKVNTAVSLQEKHGQYYARWRSDEIVTTAKGEEKRKEYFEPTYVPIPDAGSSKEVVKAQKKLAQDAGEYMAALVSPQRPSAELQKIKLAEFTVRSSGMGKESIRGFFPLFLIDYSLAPDQNGKLPLRDAVRTMQSTLNRVLKELHGDRRLHPSAIPTHRLQNIVDKIGGKQERHVINLRCAYRYGVEKGMVLKSLDPSEDLKIKASTSSQRIPYEETVIQHALVYMLTINDGDMWRLATVTGVYTPMRMGTMCKLQIKPVDFVRPSNPRKCGFLDMSKPEWRIEFYDTKGKKWEIQILHAAYVAWLIPYIAKHKLGPGDYFFPALARRCNCASAQWQQIIEKSGYKMKYAVVNGHKVCLTGYHSLRISLDKWAKENAEVELSQEDVEENLLRHGKKAHRGSYDSGVLNVAQQRRINASRPVFLPGASDATLALFAIRKKKQALISEVRALTAAERELTKNIEKKNNEIKTDDTGSAAAA
jgi:hypothetical protein